MSKNNKTLVLIAGPTAVGKTSLSIDIAQYFQTVILSADSRQFYKELEIGTAKPTATELHAVTHYFINSLSIHDAYDVATYEKEALRLLDQMFTKNDVVVVTGGSGLFLQALCDGLDDMPAIPTAIRAHWNEQYKTQGLAFLQSELKKIDPDYYQIVDSNNPMRLIRALEVYEASGKNMTFWRGNKKVKERPFKCIKIALERDREELYSRINLRMDQMIEAGLFEEAEKFYPLQKLNALQTVGYSEIFGYLSGQYDREEAVRLLKRNSRRYAKRQLTWFKRDAHYQWFHPDDYKSILQYITQSLD